LTEKLFFPFHNRKHVFPEHVLLINHHSLKVSLVGHGGAENIGVWDGRGLDRVIINLDDIHRTTSLGTRYWVMPPPSKTRRLSSSKSTSISYLWEKKRKNYQIEQLERLEGDEVQERRYLKVNPRGSGN